MFIKVNPKININPMWWILTNYVKSQNPPNRYPDILVAVHKNNLYELNYIFKLKCKLLQCPQSRLFCSAFSPDFLQWPQSSLFYSALSPDRRLTGHLCKSWLHCEFWYSLIFSLIFPLWVPLCSSPLILIFSQFRCMADQNSKYAIVDIEYQTQGRAGDFGK